MRPLKRLFDLLRERAGCFVVDRYVFGLSIKHPIVSVKDLNSQAFQPTLARRKNGLFVYRFWLILAKFEAPAAPQKMAQNL